MKETHFIKTKDGVFVNVAAIVTATIKTAPAETRIGLNPAYGYSGEPKEKQYSSGEVRSVKIFLSDGAEHTIRGDEAEKLIAIITN
jgi:hypothetical protein